jgi:hypothetical protein
MRRSARVVAVVVVLAVLALGGPAWGTARAMPRHRATLSNNVEEQHPDQVLEWNQIFIDTLIATNTANSSSQRDRS